jgi:hypothetical protein
MEHISARARLGMEKYGSQRMSKEDDYRRNAADTMQLARRASSNEDKGRLVMLAEAWLDLAERARGAAKRLRRPLLVHPLVQKKLDQYLE